MNIDIPVISMSKTTTITIGAQFPWGIIGVRKANGEYPIINFIKTQMELCNGIFISGSNKFIEYMIVENSLNYGVHLLVIIIYLIMLFQDIIQVLDFIFTEIWIL